MHIYRLHAEYQTFHWVRKCFTVCTEFLHQSNCLLYVYIFSVSLHYPSVRNRKYVMSLTWEQKKTYKAQYWQEACPCHV